MSTNEIRSSFLRYFRGLGHEVVKSSSLVPYNDPSLMFTNSGMVQFKDVFLGKEIRSYTTATTSQKSVRAGGKHNDLDNVGYTRRHLTFFEMLGNFSFGDYFKDEAIKYAWHFLTEELGLDKDKLYITVYYKDDEAANIWRKVTGFPDYKIIRINTNDNFWSMGDVGPCGPCSEIFYDQGPGLQGGLPGTPEQDGDRYIEIWNLVFMQNEQTKNGLIELPKKSIDTGMGLERIAAVMQKSYDNFGIDLFKLMIENISDITSTRSEGDHKFSHRVIADHLRSSSFLIADGVVPSNEGRGYVLRRIIRRAVRHIHHLGHKDLLLPKLLPILCAEMGLVYPELIRHQEMITSILAQEEESFRATIGKGIRLIDTKTQDLRAGAVLSGKVAFELHDTYGFPLDITEDILKSRGIKVDVDEFEKCMNAQKELAKKAWVGSGESEVGKVWFDIKNSKGGNEFLGYTDISATGEVVAIVQDGHEVSEVSQKKEFYIVANQTPFYAESGGQMGDVGTIYDDNGLKIQVLDTKKPLPGIHAHLCKLESGSLKVGSIVKLQINTEYRNGLRRNHSATHLLHAILREVLGAHVSQRGSLVAADRLRFDFSHNKALPREQLDIIEFQINKLIMNDFEVSTRLMRYDDAVSTGAMALFGEKYDSEVRVVSVGNALASHSIELCGGTHVGRVGEIGGIKIISESSVSSGIRRIEAVTGAVAYKSWRHENNLLNDLATLLRVKSEDIIEKVHSMIAKNKQLEKEMRKQSQSSLANEINEDSIEKIGDVYFAVQKMKDDTPMEDLRGFAQQYLASKDCSVIILFSTSGERVFFVSGVTKDIHNKLTAKYIAQTLNAALEGNGGGNEFIAQGGAKFNEAKVDAAIVEVTNFLKTL